MDIYIMSGDNIGESVMASGLVAGFLLKPLSRDNILSVLKKYPAGSGVMVVDDQERIRDLIDNIISSAGNKTVVCSSGEEAIQKYAGDIPLVFSDCKMPRMNGLELAKTLKEKAGNKV